LVAGFGVAAVLSEEAYQADPAMCGVGGSEGDKWRTPDSVEDIGFASVVERFCVCVAQDSCLGCGKGMWVETFSKGFPRGCRGEKFFSQGFVFLGCQEIQKISAKYLSYLSAVLGKGAF